MVPRFQLSFTLSIRKKPHQVLSKRSQLQLSKSQKSDATSNTNKRRHAHTRTHVHTHTRAHAHTHTRTHTHTLAHTHTCTYAHTHTCTYTHTCTHTYSHTPICTWFDRIWFDLNYFYSIKQDVYWGGQQFKLEFKLGRVWSVRFKSSGCGCCRTRWSEEKFKKMFENMFGKMEFLKIIYVLKLLLVSLCWKRGLAHVHTLLLASFQAVSEAVLLPWNVKHCLK